MADDLPAPDVAAACQASMASVEAEALLSKLRELPSVSGVNTKPSKPANKANHFGVNYKIKLPDGGWKSRRSRP